MMIQEIILGKEQVYYHWRWQINKFWLWWLLFFQSYHRSLQGP